MTDHHNAVVSIMVRVSPEIAAAIDADCGGLCSGGRDRRGGRAWCIYKILCDHYNVELPAIKPKCTVNLDHIDIRKISDPKSRLIAKMYKESGSDLGVVLQRLRDEKIATPRGGQWIPRTIQQYLERVVKMYTPKPPEGKPRPKPPVKKKRP